MMLELAQHIQVFLHKHDRPPVSLYEEMVERQRAEEKERQLSRIKEEEQVHVLATCIILLVEGVSGEPGAD
jgi:RNase H-fold protein (predicted Holliday junction resolvase)